MYRYRVRPGYGSTELLIEIQLEPADQSFSTELKKVLKQLNGRGSELSLLSSLSDAVYDFNSDAGPFSITIDIWDIVFITAPNNQSAILKIAEVLRTNAQFEQEIVEFDEYKNVSQ